MRTTDLTQGSIFRNLWSMAIPLLAASFIQMAYTLTDILWLGRLGSESVAAVGAAGFFIWLGNALSLITKVGVEITVSQSMGVKDYKRAASYANHAITLSSFIGLAYSCFIVIAAPGLIDLFDFDANISEKAVNYLRMIAPGLFFHFNNNTFNGIYNGQGDSRTPFLISAIGLSVNIILDPLLIYGYGPFPRLETSGAAIATVFAQTTVFALFYFRIFSKRFPLGEMKIIYSFIPEIAKKIVKLGLPVSLQNALFSMFSLTLSTVAARWGAVGVAAQSIGAQIEALSWMTAAGFSTALAAFTGQNYGAGNYERIRKAYRITLSIAGSIGLFAGILFFWFNKEIFSLFVDEADAIEAGGNYLKIMALSQVFMVTESVTTGAFNGTGRTTLPAIVGIVFTASRIPLAFLLITFPTLGLTGIWWSVTITSIIKGTILPLLFLRFQQRHLISKTKIKEFFL